MGKYVMERLFKVFNIAGMAFIFVGGHTGYISGKDGTWTPDISNEDSRTTVEMKLPFGTYHFYAFANLQSLDDGTSLYQKITEMISG